ncbi:MAG: hypothetical protein ABL895_14610 [Cyclobacteriaceae bacterium]
MQVSPEQLNIIQIYIQQSNITITTLKDDLLDHLCCVVENKMRDGKKFEISLKEAVHELAPEGLEIIQQETIFLLNTTKQMLMKKIMYAIGLLSTISMTMGVTFKILHMPGAEQLFNYGFFPFLLIFLPMIAIDRYKRNLSKATFEKLRMGTGFLSSIVIGSSVFFKIFHLEGADVLLLAGIGIFCFTFLPFLFFSMYKKSISET